MTSRNSQDSVSKLFEKGRVSRHQRHITPLECLGESNEADVSVKFAVA